MAPGMTAKIEQVARVGSKAEIAWVWGFILLDIASIAQLSRLLSEDVNEFFANSSLKSATILFQ